MNIWNASAGTYLPVAGFGRKATQSLCKLSHFPGTPASQLWIMEKVTDCRYLMDGIVTR